MPTQPNNPIINGQVLSANLTQSVADVKCLIIANKLPSGTAPADIILENVLNDASVWDTAFASDSVAASMTRGFREVNQGRIQSELDVIPVDDAAGTAATGDTTVVGTATEDGTLTVNVASETNKTPYTFPITVTNTDTATAVGAAIEAALPTEARIPVTAVNTAGAVVLTAKNSGTQGNAISISISGAVAGLTFTMTGMSGGATDPSLTAVIAAIQGKRYQFIMVPSGWDVTALKTELELRDPADNKILDGHLFQAKTDTFANLLAFGTSENSKHTTFLGFEKTTIVNEYDAPEFFALDYGMTAYFGGLIALRLTQGAQIGNILASTTNAARDVFGGPHSASLPFHNTLIPTLNPSDKDGFTDTEIAQLGNTGGITVIGNNSANNAVVMGTVYTSYKTDNAGNPDDTFKFLNSKLSSFLVREKFFVVKKDVLSQTRLVTGALKPGFLESNVASLRSLNNTIYSELEDLRLVDSGPESRRFFNEKMVVEIVDLVAGKVFESMEFKVVGQLRQLDFTVQPNFDT